jgi:tight adherence protein B
MNQFIAPTITALVIAAWLCGLFLIVRNRLDARRLRLLKDIDDEPLQLISPPAPRTDDWAGHLDHRFDQFVKGSGGALTPEQALGITALCGVSAGGLLLLWRDDLALALVGVIAGMALPLVVFRGLRARWEQRLQDQLPDAYFLLARSLRAGENLEQGLRTVAEHGPQPLAGEFRDGIEKIRLGLSVPATLQLIARRLRLADFDVLVTAVTLHRTLGGNLALLLDRVAASTRDRNQFRGYFRAATALGRTTGLFISAVPPLLFLGYWLWQPEILGRFLNSSLGQRGLAMAVILEIVGSIWLYLLLKFDY